MAGRVLLAVVAVAVLAWLAVGLRAAHLQASGHDLLRPGATAQELDRAGRDLRRARFLNPDTAPDVDLGLLAKARGDGHTAVARLEDVVRREPENVLAWGVLAVLAADTDPAAAARAEAARARLDPVNARRGR